MPDAQTAHIQAYHKGVLSTELAALVGSAAGHVLAITGHTTAGDGGEGLARWTTSTADSDDGGITWGATASGRWKRLFYGDVDIKWFGAKGDGADATAAIQAAINTGKGVIFPAGSYACALLTQSTASQRLYCPSGIAILAKNANGTLMTSSGADVVFERIRFYGGDSAYSGTGVLCSGAGAQLVDCASNNMSGRAVIMTGENTSIVGCCGSYATTDSSSTGFDIEIGLTGTVRLYGKIEGIRTNQATGGIKLIDTGAWAVSISQFGKLTWSNPTGGAGAGPGRTTNNRVNGNVSVQGSNGIFAGNQFSAVTITFESGSGFNTLDASNNTTAATIVDNGNNYVAAYDATSARKMRIGASASLAILDIDVDGEFILPANTYTKNNQNLALRNAADNANALYMTVSSGDNGFIAHSGGSYMAISSSGTLQLIGTSGIDISSPLTTHLVRKSNLGVTASTTQTQAAGIALGLTGDIIHVSTCANANDAIALPTAVAGREATVLNKGANTLQIFPFTSDNLGAGVDASTTLAAGSSRRFVAVDTTNWVVV